MNWLTADTHFFHNNVRKYTGRPDASLEEMHERLIAYWREHVMCHDTVYHMGDFSFGNLNKTLEILDRLTGTICLVGGNHDVRLRKKPRFTERFEWVKDYHEMNYEGRKVVMSHYPFASWNGMHRGSWMLHGHSHGSHKRQRGRILDVGVDGPIGEPLIRMSQVAHYMETREADNTVDHHTEESK